MDCNHRGRNWQHRRIPAEHRDPHMAVHPDLWGIGVHGHRAVLYHRHGGDGQAMVHEEGGQDGCHRHDGVRPGHSLFSAGCA